MRERRHIVGAIAQRRQIDAHRRQAAVEIAAEAMRVDVGVDAGRRAGDQANRGGDRRAVDADLAVARDARQLRLRARRAAR